MALKDTDDAKMDADEADSSLDMSQAAVKKMIADARERGYITYDQLNAVLPPNQASSEQIEDVMSMLSEMGINVIEDEEAEEGLEPATGELVETSTSREIAVAGTTAEALDRTDDPVRMYLREMGSVELLSREGEIAIAKRIEAGRNTMIAGLCESPLTFHAITVWRDELLSEDILLRDVIDLEATFGRSLDGEEDLEGASLGEVDVDAPRRGRTRTGRRRQPHRAHGRRRRGRRKFGHVAGCDGSGAETPRPGNPGSHRARLCETGRNAGQPHECRAEFGQTVFSGG
jgi:RNA polymerase primary sigma factor